LSKLALKTVADGKAEIPFALPQGIDGDAYSTYLERMEEVLRQPNGRAASRNPGGVGATPGQSYRSRSPHGAARINFKLLPTSSEFWTHA